jgi:photosystem II stability/assembly factor-like uncharacterized protein
MYVSRRILIIIFPVLIIIDSINGQWIRLPGPTGGSQIYAIIPYGNTLLSGSGYYGISRSFDNGYTWVPVMDSISKEYIRSLATLGSVIIAGTTWGNFWRSTDGGTNWVKTKNKSIITSSSDIRQIDVNGHSMLAACYGVGLCRSSDSGKTWNIITGSMPLGALANSVLCSNDSIFLGTYEAGLYLSVNDGVTWTTRPDSTIGKNTVIGLYRHQNALYAAVINNGLYRSLDNGRSWITVNNGLPLVPTDPRRNSVVSSFVSIGNTIIVGTLEGVYVSTDLGDHWTVSDSGIPHIYVTSLTIKSGILFAGTESAGIFRSADSAKSWELSGNGISYTGISAFLSDNDTLWVGTLQNGVSYSTDDGLTWRQTSYRGLTNLYVNAIAHMGAMLFSATAGKGTLYVLKSSKSSHWELMNSGIETDSLFSLAVSRTSLFVGTGRGIMKCNGSSNVWIDATQGVITGKVNCLTASKKYILAGTDSQGVFLSNDCGVTWQKTMIPSMANCFSVAINGNFMFAGTEDGLYRSIDRGINWTPTPFQFQKPIRSKNVSSIAISGNTVFAGTIGYGRIAVSTDNGTSWREIPEDYPDTLCDDCFSFLSNVAIHHGYLFAARHSLGIDYGLVGESIWRRPVNGLVDLKQTSLPFLK